MNIFILDLDFEKNARFHVDKHVNKMQLEAAQMMCAAYRLYPSIPIEQLDFKVYEINKIHHNHPCTKWVRESLQNWLWLKSLVNALNEEAKFRYKKSTNHKSCDVINKLPFPKLPEIGLTKFALAMPDIYKQEDPVESYRQYYIYDKTTLHKWKNRETPFWLKEFSNNS